jgi:ABC-type transport system involved in multi-copper enzyme maturation permease subunit
MAAYVNVLLYGCISASFAFMTFIYDVERIGFLIQSIIYFLVTSTICLFITMLLWQLQRYPAALLGTLAGYLITHVIMITMAYRRLRSDVREINQELLPADAQ